MSEKIVAAAVRAEGLVFSVEKPGRHHHILHRMDALGIDAALRGHDQGFLTSSGRYVDRTEGLGIAREADQVIHKHGNDRTLFSEDMW